MPKKAEEALRKEGIKKGLKGKALDNFIYGILNKEGLMKGNKMTAKGMMSEHPKMSYKDALRATRLK